MKRTNTPSGSSAASHPHREASCRPRRSAPGRILGWTGHPSTFVNQRGGSLRGRQQRSGQRMHCDDRSLLCDLLPNDLLARILFSGFFDSIEVVNKLCKISRRIKAIAESSVASLDLRKLRLGPGDVQTLVSQFKCLGSLDFSFCEGINDAAVEKLLPLQPTLTSLTLHGCPVTDIGIRTIGRLSMLKHLDLSKSCYSQTGQITDEGASALAELKLTTLALAWNKRVTDKGLRVALRSSVRGLVALDLQLCVQITDVGLEALSDTRDLQHLNLSGCTALTSEGLKKLISAAARTLTSLRVAHCPAMDIAVAKVVLGLPKIVDVDIRGCDRLDPAVKHALLKKVPDAEA